MAGNMGVGLKVVSLDCSMDPATDWIGVNTGWTATPPPAPGTPAPETVNMDRAELWKRKHQLLLENLEKTFPLFC